MSGHSPVSRMREFGESACYEHPRLVASINATHQQSANEAHRMHRGELEVNPLLRNTEPVEETAQ